MTLRGYDMNRFDLDSPITSGEILLREYLEPMGISQNAMARAIGVAPRAVNEIIHAKRSITPAMSIRFGAFFGQSDEFWHRIQVECDFRRLAEQRGRLTNGICPGSTLATRTAASDGIRHTDHRLE